MIYIASCVEEARKIACQEKRHVLFGKGPLDKRFRMPNLRQWGLCERETLRRYQGCFLTTDLVKYNGIGTAYTITLNSLAASTTAGRQSTVVDNSSNLYDDYGATVIISTSASAIGSSKTVAIYVAGSFDGTNFDQDDGVMGASDAAYTINDITNLKQGVIMYCPTSSKVYNATFSIAGLWGGVMPEKHAIVVCNDTNQSLGSSGNSASWTGITYTNS